MLCCCELCCVVNTTLITTDPQVSAMCAVACVRGKQNDEDPSPFVRGKQNDEDPSPFLSALPGCLILAHVVEQALLTQECYTAQLAYNMTETAFHRLTVHHTLSQLQFVLHQAWPCPR